MHGRKSQMERFGNFLVGRPSRRPQQDMGTRDPARRRFAFVDHVEQHHSPQIELLKYRSHSMAFRKPITTLGGLIWWNIIKQNEYFILQEHKAGLPVWPYKYRITLRLNRMEIANSNNPDEIQMDWKYLETNTIPQINEQIDIGKRITEIDYMKLINTIITLWVK